MMQRWDGYDKDRRFKYSEDQIDIWDMTIDEKGTVYYISHETVPKQYIWCVADRLSGHLRYLCGFGQAQDTQDKTSTIY